MYIVWGEKFYGRVDAVPGFFHIATKFGHIDHVPLFPLSSHIVFSKDSKSGDARNHQAISIPLNGKSILLTYACVLTGAGCITAVLVLMTIRNDPQQVNGAILAGSVSGVLLVVWLILMFAKRVRRASYHRACQLGFLADLTDSGWEKLNAQYGRSGNLPQP